MIVDACHGPDGFYLLMEDGAICAQERVNSASYQHLPVSQRPTHAWQRLPGPDVAVPARILVKGRDIHVLGDGILWERVRDIADITNVFRPAWIWREVVLPGSEAPVPVNPPAPVRAEVLTVAAPQPGAMERQGTTPQDTFEAQRVAARANRKDDNQ